MPDRPTAEELRLLSDQRIVVQQAAIEADLGGVQARNVRQGRSPVGGPRVQVGSGEISAAMCKARPNFGRRRSPRKAQR